MSSSRRALSRFSKLFSRRRRKALRPRGLVHGEGLELRQLMAGDFNPFHNYIYAQDVNSDWMATPLDALLVINELNASGPHQLSSTGSGGAAGEGAGLDTLIDVNGDGYLTPLDALEVINHLNAQGADPNAVVQFQTLLVGENGQYLTPSGGSGTTADPWEYRLSKDERYGVSIIMKDNRPSQAPGFNNSPLGIFASFIDVNFDPSKTKLGFEEVQQFTFAWSGGGTSNKVKIDVPGLGTTPDITVSRTDSSGNAADIEAALNELSGDPSNKVFSVSNNGDIYFVKFFGDFVDRDAPQLTLTRTGTGATANNLAITNQGTIFQPASANTALKSDMDAAMNFNRLYTPLSETQFPARTFEVYTTNSGTSAAVIRSGAIATGDYLADANGTDYQTDRQFIDENIAQIDTTGFIEFFRPWFVASAATGSSTPTVISIEAPGEPDDNENDTVSATLLIANVQGFEPKVPRSLIDFGAPIEIIITADVSANPDAVTTTEDTGIANIDVLKLAAADGTAGKDKNNTGADAALKITGLGPNGNLSSFPVANQGTVTLTGQTISFAPAQDFFGTFTFQYGLTNDGSATPKDTGTVTITVTETNDNPIAGNDTVTLNEDAGATNITTTLLANDNSNKDPVGAGGDNLVITQVNGAASANTGKGTVSVTGGVVSYTPNANASGSDTFTYTLSDGRGGTATATVNITITEINDAPTFLIDGATHTSAEDTGAQSQANFATAINPGPANASPQETGTVTFIVTPVSVPASLTFLAAPAISSTGTLTYQANANAFGTATFNVTATDGSATSSPPVLITINVTPVNDPPDFTIPATFQSNEGASVSQSNFVTNISAGINEGAAGVTYVVTVLAPPGSLTFTTPPAINAAGQLTFVPTTNAFGTATVQVVAHDNGTPDLTLTKTFSLTVVDINDAPDAVDDPSLEAPDGEVNSFLDVLANDSSAPDVGAPGEVLLVDPAVPLVFLDAVPANVSVSIKSDGSGLQVTSPLGLITGSLRVRYTIRDRAIGQSGSLSDNAIATINFVSAALPRAIPDSFPNAASPNPVLEDNGGFATIDVLANDRRFDATNGVLTITGIRFPGQTVFETVRDTVITDANGSQFKISPNGLSLQFKPGADVFGAVNVEYRVEETPAAGDGPSVGVATVNVTEVNDNPIAGNDTITLVEDAGATILTTGANSILSNDNAGKDPTSGAAGTFDVLKITQVNGGVAATTKGTVNVDANGVVTYTPNPNANGSDSFTYTLSDGRGGTATATVNITITPVNDPPSFTVGTVTHNEGVGPVSVPNFATNINPGPANSDPAETGTVTFNTPTQLTSSSTLTFTTPPSIAPDGTLTFEAATNAFGIATFSVTATDNGNATSAAQQFTITIAEINDNPVANNDNVTVNEDSGENTLTASMLSNDNAGPDPTSGAAGTFDVLKITQVNGGVAATTKGTVSVDANGVVTYTPNNNASGADSFTYTLSDGRGGTATATVNITITEVNDPPTFVLPANITRTEDFGVVTQAAFVTSNPGPVNADPQETGTVSFAVTQVSSSSTLTFTQAPAIAPDGTLTFRAADNARGTATFNVIATDNGNASSAAQQFTITITPVNDAPIANNDGPYRVFKQTADYTATPALTANDSSGVDAGDALEILRILSATITTTTPDAASPAGAAAALTVEVAANGQTVILHNPNGFFGQVIVTYTLTDRADGTGFTPAPTATATFNVVNFLPGFVTGRVWADSDGEGDIDLLNPPMGPERFIAGIEVYVYGTTLFGAPFKATAITNERGEYTLNDPSLPNGGLTPGTYTISLDNPDTTAIEAPELLSNGADTAGSSTVAGAITHLSENTYRLTFNEEGVTVSNLNLAVLGLESQYVNIRDSLSNSTSNGVVFGANMGAAANAQTYWFSLYDGWTGMHDLAISITKNASGTPISAVVTGRDTNNALFTKSLSFTADYTKIRIMGMQGNNIVIRLVGTASEFFPTADLIAEVAAPGAEGEGYADAVDEIYGSWS